MKFQSNLIRAAAIVAAEKDIVLYLNGVRIEYKPGEDHVWIVGTDGAPCSSLARSLTGKPIRSSC